MCRYSVIGVPVREDLISSGTETGQAFHTDAEGHQLGDARRRHTFHDHTDVSERPPRRSRGVVGRRAPIEVIADLPGDELKIQPAGTVVM